MPPCHGHGTDDPRRAATPLRRLPALLVAALGLLIATAFAPATSMASVCTPPVANQVACENMQTGTPEDEWDIDGAGDPSIQGFATQISVNHGDTISFKIKSATSNYHIDILRLGYYGGDGARRVVTHMAPTGTSVQPPCDTYSATGLIDCGNWATSASWTVPSTAVSGVYIAYLKRDDAEGGASQIQFVVRDDSSHSDVVLSTSDATWEAYNTYGGNSLYQCTVACPDGDPAAYKAAYAVSYNRPLHVAEDDGGRSGLFTGAEYPMIRFLEENGYDVSYISSVDENSRGSLLQNHKLFISSGHDEYWSAGQRSSMEAARDAGVNEAFFSGNEGYWKTRFAPSQSGTATADRTLVSYKDSHFATQQDPVAFTGAWRDPRYSDTPDSITPENSLTGQSFLVNGGTADLTVAQVYGKMRLWRNTAAATLGSGQSLTLGRDTLGYEWDVDADNGFRPAGEVHLSSTTVSDLDAFLDYTNTTSGGGSTATHNLTLYRAPSGAKVFGAGTVQWAWGLSDWNPSYLDPDPNMEQATINMLADLKAQPATLQSDLKAATASTDTTGPTSTLTTPASTVADGTKVTLSGTAVDSGGGQVAGIEVSTDGGTTWHPATTGTSSWTYTWIAHGYPSTVIKVRATDDSGNIGAATAGATVNVTCPCSVFGSNVTPAAPDSGDPTPVEVGVRFKSDRFGTVSGIRFYKTTANTGTHIGSLWTDSGTRIAQATFTGESASGWQSVSFSSPVPINPNTTYIASYYAPNGHYSATSDYFWQAPAPGPNGGAITDAPPLHFLKDVTAEPNGLFSYSTSSTLPINSTQATNYWVDVAFTPSPAPGTVTGVTATSAGNTSAHVSWSPPSTGGTVTSYTITPYVGTTAQTAKTITGTPPDTDTTITGLTKNTTYTFSVHASNPTGDGPESAKSASVTPSGPVIPTQPKGVTASAASNSVLVSWNAPDSDGDSPITGYTVTPYDGATPKTATTTSGDARSVTVTGLDNSTIYTFKVTATNAIGTGPASAASAGVTPQATIFDLATPSTPDAGDGSAVEVGVKVKSDFSGSITGIRFYKSAANTGTHVGSLWTVGGTRLAQATFTNESASGWQTATFATPVSVTAGTTYVASYFAPSGHYSVGSSLSAGADNGPLHALADSSSSNGVYAYGSSSTFPTNSYNASNYFVDITFSLAKPGTPTSVTASNPTRTTADVSWSAPSTGGGVTSYKITPYVGTTAQTAATVTGTPAATSTTISGLSPSTAYTFTVEASNASGTGPASAASNTLTTTATSSAPGAPTGVVAKPATTSALVSWTPPTSVSGDPALTGFTITPYVGTTAQTPTTAGPDATSATITGLTNGTSYTFKVAASNAVGTGNASTASAITIPRATIFDFGTPGTADVADSGSLVLGAKFTSDVAGSITGVRFYKSSANTGTHIGSLWTAGGTLLASATFTGETDSGWQTALFSSPIAITASTTYVVSYLSPNGHYSADGGTFSTNPFDHAPLHALSTLSSPNGVYTYSGTVTFPNNSYNATNYWVDVLFAAGS